MLAGAEAAQEVIDRTHAEPQGTIRLSCAAGADPLFPGRADRALHGQVPEGAGLPEELQPSGGRAARGLRPGRAGTLRPIESSDLVMKPLGISGQRLVAAPALARRGAARRPERARPAADAGAGHRRTRKPLEAGRAGRRPPERASSPRLVTDDMMALKQAAVQGVGAAALPLLMIREELADGRLIDVGRPWALEPGSVHACRHAGGSCPACASCWISWAPNTRSWPGANARNAGSWANAPSPAVGLPACRGLPGRPDPGLAGQRPADRTLRPVSTATAAADRILG